MKVAAVQYKAPKGDKDRALQELTQLAQRAAPDRDLVVFPEMAATGYLFDSPDHVATVAESPEGATFQALSVLARAHRSWFVVGFPERDGDRFFNSALVIDREGRLAFVYRKTLLYEADLPWATPGDSGYRAFDTGNGRFGVGICMDLNDDGFIAWCAQANLRALALPTNWVHEDDAPFDVWTYWALRMRPAAGVALVAANTFGVEGNTVFAGESAVLQGFSLLGGAPPEGVGIVRVDVPPLQD